MKFIVQKELVEKQDLEVVILLNKLKEPSMKYLHSYEIVKMGDLDNGEYAGYIPIGDIPFVSKYIKIYYGVEKENPIEVPECLRTNKFLKRDYSIVAYDDLPKKGVYFIKDASELKKFSYTGEISYLEECWNPNNKSISALKLDRDHLYVLSEAVDILAEYRVYVLCGKIEAIVQYDGDPLILPDTDLIKEAHERIKAVPGNPRSYTIDVMVTPRGTSIIEVHNFTSVGLYTTLFGDSLLYAYRDGLDYLLNSNIETKKFKGKTKENLDG